MSDDPDHTRRWLVRASGAAILSNALASGPSYSKDAGAPAAKAQDPDEPVADAPISPVTAALCDYVADTLDRNMPPEVVVLVQHELCCQRRPKCFSMRRYSDQLRQACTRIG